MWCVIKVNRLLSPFGFSALHTLRGKIAKKLSSCFLNLFLLRGESLCAHSNAKIVVIVPFLGFAGHIWRADYSGCKNYHFRFGSLDLSSFLSSSTLFSPTMQTSLWRKISLLNLMRSHGLFVSIGVHKNAANM